MAKGLSAPAKRLLFWSLLTILLAVIAVLIFGIVAPIVYFHVGNAYVMEQMQAATQASIESARERDEAARNAPAVVESTPSEPANTATSPPDSDSNLTTEQQALVTNTLRGMAESWLALIDQGKYAEAWAAQSDQAKGMNPLDRWTQTMQTVRAPAGGMVSRSYSDCQVLQGMPNDPPTYVISYSTTFQNRTAGEAVQLQQSADGAWHLISYQIMP